MALLVTLRAADNTLRFARLSSIAMLVLIVPHSKEEEEEERVFHGSEEQDTFCPSLNPKGTLSNILTIKLVDNLPAHSY